MSEIFPLSPRPEVRAFINPQVLHGCYSRVVNKYEAEGNPPTLKLRRDKRQKEKGKNWRHKDRQKAEDKYNEIL